MALDIINCPWYYWIWIGVQEHLALLINWHVVLSTTDTCVILNLIYLY